MFRQSTAGPDQTLDIVIYEEDHLTRNLLHEWLGEAGYRVHSGALREAKCACPADLVIASIYMPKQSGSRWVRDIQAAHPGVPLIAISGQFRSGLRAAGETAQSLGVQQVMAKPLVRVDLLSAVRDMIGTPPRCMRALNVLTR
jgi:DNA-binding NtrC family response regulator